MSTTIVSPLRQRMIEDMSLRNLAPRTQEFYIRSCKKLAAFLHRSPDAATAEDIRLFQLHLAEQGVSICTRNRTMTAIAFLFRVTLRRPEIADQIEYIAEPQKIPLVLSREEVRRLLDAAPGFKYRLLLSLAYGCGLRASEVVSLKVSDIDSAQMVIRIEQGKGRKDRYVMLSPELLDMLRQWWKATRPQGWLFPGRPAVNPLTTRQLNRIFHLAAEAAEIRKGATLHTLRHSCDPFVLPAPGRPRRRLPKCSKSAPIIHARSASATPLPACDRLNPASCLLSSMVVGPTRAISSAVNSYQIAIEPAATGCSSFRDFVH